MDCMSCGEHIPDDSIFCPECGARQDLSRAGGFTTPNSVGLAGQEVTGGRSFGVVSGEAIRQQREMSVSDPNAISPELMRQIAQGMQNQQNIPPVGNFPPQGFQNQPNNLNQNPMNDLGNMPQNIPNVTPMGQSSPTDEMVTRLAQAEKAMKTERRSQWLNMNQASASNVLSSLGADLPAHLRNEKNAAQEILTGALGGQKEAPNDAFLRRMCEVAVRRVARKRGVAVETPQAKLADDILTVNITYIDDGRVLDTPEDLSQAFEHAIQTEVALKGFDYVSEINLYRSRDGEIENLSEEEQDDGEMFACEICDGLVKESDSECPHCGAVFEEDDDFEEPSPRQAPNSPSRGSPPRGSSRGGPPGGPSRGGPPGGPSRGGLPGGSSRGGPPGGPSRGGPPGGPSRGGPPGGPSKGPGRAPPSKSPPRKKPGPPGGSTRGPPSGGPKSGPPKGPKRGPPR
jgi:RNA polymerase subunit RPABC4/transcription elongation factor Spt4